MAHTRKEDCPLTSTEIRVFMRDVLAAVRGLTFQALKTNTMVAKLIKQGGVMAKTLDELLVKVTQADTVDDSMIALLRAIKAELDLITAGGLPPDAQAKVDALFKKIEDGEAKVAAAILENTPSGTPPTT